MTADPIDRRQRTKPRNRALYCMCGELRTVAASYRGPKREEADQSDTDVGRWCRRLKCSECRTVTLHAVIADSLAEKYRFDGCSMERHNRRTDLCRRRIRRRLAALVDEGVTVFYASAPEEMTVSEATVEVVECGDARGVHVRVYAETTPERLLRAVEDAEDVVDDRAKLGPWNQTLSARWRGLAL